jgi:hypothetical protein
MNLRHAIARDNFIDLARHSSGWQPDEDRYYAAVAAAGFSAVQGGDGDICRDHGLDLLGTGVVRRPIEAAAFAAHWAEQGALAATCIAGDGFESDSEADELVLAVQNASLLCGLPIHIETHRASLTQDMWRTVRLLERHPTLTLNCDFSHWFTGLEMAALDWELQIERLRPVFAQTHFLHGRVGDRCCMQVSLRDGREDKHLLPFRALWREVMRHRSEGIPTADLWFVPELLGTRYEYARVFEDREEGDRWRDALLLRQVADDCFQEL